MESSRISACCAMCSSRARCICVSAFYPAEGRQHIKPRLLLEDGAALEVIAHCFFPNAQQVEHLMDAHIEIGDGARLSYREGHYHGPLRRRERASESDRQGWQTRCLSIRFFADQRSRRQARYRLRGERR